MVKNKYSYEKRQKEIEKKKKKEQKRLNKINKNVEEGQTPLADNKDTTTDSNG